MTVLLARLKAEDRAAPLLPSAGRRDDILRRRAECAKKRRGTEVSGRKNPPFAEKREGWGTLKFRVWEALEKETQKHSPFVPQGKQE